MNAQTTSHLLMIRPVQFGFNTQTAVNNAFQSVQDTDAQQLARMEFDQFVDLLQRHEIDVTVINDTSEPHTPDSIFPNNWISFHDNGSIVLYPMYAENRRLERKDHVLERLQENFRIGKSIDLTAWETHDQFLEGTGSMVLDRTSKIAYACISERTDKEVLADFCSRLGFSACSFAATDKNGVPIYHTNVMMCIAEQYAIVCLDTISGTEERKKVVAHIAGTGKEIIEISISQVNQFAGNMLQVHNASGKKFLIMSSQAFISLLPDQLLRIRRYNEILHSPLDVIERNGGGSARCMMAEVFLPPVQ